MAKVKRNRANKTRKIRDADRVYYVVRITGWDWSFMFGVDPRPEHEGAHMDYRHLEVQGEVLRPARLKGRACELTFLPDTDLNAGETPRRPLIHAGSLSLHRGQLDGLFSIPADVLPAVLQMLIGNRFQYVIIYGDPMRYRHASALRYRFEMRLDDHDLPGET